MVFFFFLIPLMTARNGFKQTALNGTHYMLCEECFIIIFALPVLLKVLFLQEAYCSVLLTEFTFFLNDFATFSNISDRSKSLIFCI